MSGTSAQCIVYLRKRTDGQWATAFWANIARALITSAMPSSARNSRAKPLPWCASMTACRYRYQETQLE